MWFTDEEAEEHRDEVSYPTVISGISIQMEVGVVLELHLPDVGAASCMSAELCLFRTQR